MFNFVPSVKFPPVMLIVDDVEHTVALVCTCGLNEILGFENWENKIEEEEGRDNSDSGSGEWFVHY